MVIAFLVDPVIARALGAALSVVFLAGAWQKFREPLLFRAALENYRLLPERFIDLVARGLPLLEGAAGVLLLFAETRSIGGGLAALLLFVVTVAVAINLWRGNADIDCGCGWLGAEGGEQPLSWGLVARNALLVAALPLALADGSQRTLVWIDYLTVACATLALLGLYLSANQLLANQPRLHAMRNV